MVVITEHKNFLMFIYTQDFCNCISISICNIVQFSFVKKKTQQTLPTITGTNSDGLTSAESFNHADNKNTKIKGYVKGFVSLPTDVCVRQQKKEEFK